MCSSTLLGAVKSESRRSTTDLANMINSKKATNGTSIGQLSSTDNKRPTRQHQLSSFLVPFLLVAFISFAVLEFSHWFPFSLFGLAHAFPKVESAAIGTYIPAWYQYDDELTHFDNTPWTYNTDYVLTVVMSVLAIICLRTRAPDDCPVKNKASLKLRLYSASLLICYGLSTLAGGWAHQHFTSIESLNTTRFRIFWYLCVGNVSFASCYMGLIGREVQKVFGVEGAVPLGPWWFWPVYGLYMNVACGLGYISFKRPACDIFIAGITQFPTTFYCLVALGIRKWPSSHSNESPIGLVYLPYRLMYYIGFIGNAPLLPMYPLLVQYSGMSLAGINTLLHACKYILKHGLLSAVILFCTLTLYLCIHQHYRADGHVGNAGY